MENDIIQTSDYENDDLQTDLARTAESSYSKMLTATTMHPTIQRLIETVGGRRSNSTRKTRPAGDKKNVITGFPFKRLTSATCNCVHGIINRISKVIIALSVGESLRSSTDKKVLSLSYILKVITKGSLSR